MFRAVFLAAILLSLTAATSIGQQQTTYTMQDGITYSTPSGQPLVADLYHPAGKGPFPAIVYVHGGGWWSGDRKQLHHQAEDLAAAGAFGMAIEYRLAPAVHFPTPLEDVRSAITWLRSHSREYNIDPSRIALMGSSAGAHLSLMHVLTPHPSSTDVSAVVAFNAVIDLTDEESQNEMVTRFLGTPCAQNAKLCQVASPLYLAKEKPHVTSRILLLHGTADKTVPYRQAPRLLEALQASGAEASLFTAPDAGHTFWAKAEWYPKSLERAKEFLGWFPLDNGSAQNDHQF